MDGILVMDKPLGPTSFDVVRRVRSLLKVKKAGHTGTLDPLATGVLPICLGDATKIAGYIIESAKGYDAVVRLGTETDTLDAGGKVVAESPVPVLTREMIEEALARFRGPFEQIPPMYSAIKQGGKRLYELARAGEEVERAPRKVTVYELLLRDFNAAELTISVRASKGFFVRTLALDIGRALGCGAHLKSLRRTQSGPFSLPQALGLEKLLGLCEQGEAGLVQVRARLVAPVDALIELRTVVVRDEDVARVLHGVPLELPRETGEGVMRVLDGAGRLLAVGELTQGRLRYRRVLGEGASG